MAMNAGTGSDMMGMLPTVPNMLAVASGKGGVGKTWLSITLAHALAQYNRNVLLFDGDLGLANVDIQLGLMPKRDLGSVLAGSISLKGAAQPYPRGGFDIIAGRSGTGSLSHVPPHRVSALMGEMAVLAPDYDQVVIDLAAGVERTTQLIAARCSRVLIVTNEEPTALTDAYALIKILAQHKVSTSVQIVINSAPSLREGERTYATLLKACENFLKISPKLAGIVRFDRSVRDSIRSQTPILNKFEGSDAARDVLAIAERLLPADQAR